MKKALFLLIAAVMALTASAIDYGIKVGGVTITDANAGNVTGDNIKAYNTSNSPIVRFDPLAKMLLVTNVRIERDGSGNRAIHNYGCDGLTIVFRSANYLYAADAAPLRLEKNTTLETADNGTTQIKGDKEDAIYITNGSTLTFNGADMLVNCLHSHCVRGDKGTEKVAVKDSKVFLGAEKSTGYYCAALYNIGQLEVEDALLSLSTREDKSPVYNLKSFSMGSGMNIFEPGNVLDGAYKKITFSSSQQTFVYADDNTAPTQEYAIINGAPVVEDFFPDEVLRNYILATKGGSDGFLRTCQAFGLDETTEITRLDLTAKQMTSLKGIEYLPHLRYLSCSINKFTSLDLSQNMELDTLYCGSNSRLTSLNLPATNTLKMLACYQTKLTTLDLSMCTGIEKVTCFDAEITSLKLPATNSLKDLNCYGNRLTSLDLSRYTNIEEVSCSSNQLTSLTLPVTNTLKELDCSNNKLGSLDMSAYAGLQGLSCINVGMTSLKLPANLLVLNCYNNQLTTLDFSPCSKIKEIRCYNNRIKGQAMTDMLNSLPICAEANSKIFLVSHSDKEEVNETTDEQVASTMERGWWVFHSDAKYGIWDITESGCKGYDLWISGYRIFSCGTKGYGYDYESETQTLTLDKDIWGYDYGSASDADHMYGRAIQSGIDGLTIKVEGDIEVGPSDDECIGIMLSGNTTIEGNGILNASGKVAIQAYNSDLTIGGNVTVKGEGVNCGINAGGTSSGTLTVKDNAIVMAMATNTSSDRSGIEGFSALRMEDHHSFTTPAGAYWQNEKVVGSDGLPVVAKWITISKKGDVNHDGKINTADVVAIYSYIEKGTAGSGIPEEDANVNDDTSVNTADVVKVYDIIINGGD